MIFGYEKFCRILKNELVIFVIEPKYCHVGIFVILNNKDLHHIFAGLSESEFLLLYQLLVTHFIFIFNLFVLQLVFIIIDDFVLFCQLFWDRLLRINLFFYDWILFKSNRVEIFKSWEFMVWNETCRVIVSHTDSVGVKHVTHTKFGIFLWVDNPHEWTVFISLVESSFDFMNSWWIFH